MNVHFLFIVLLLFGYDFINKVDTGVLSLFGYWNSQCMSKGIKFRIVRRDWRPLGPSSETDDILEEYQWGVDSAFKSLFNSNYQFEEFHISKIENIFHSKHYDKKLESIVLIHPILASADSNLIKTTITALALRNLNKQYNIFAVDMSSIGNHLLLSVARNTLFRNPKYNEVVEVLSPFLVKGIEGHHIRPGQIHLFGWSYSGHLVGYLARYVNFHYHEKIATILALDPYTNEHNNKLVHVSSEDAEVVHVYHSNSIVSGTRRRFGTADFVFNGGDVQPECRLRERGIRHLFPGKMACSHLRIVQRFWYIILYPSKFVSRRCDSWKNFLKCSCEDQPTTYVTYPIKESDSKGVYYIQTSGKKPYGLGTAGSSCPKIAKKKKV